MITHKIIKFTPTSNVRIFPDMNKRKDFTAADLNGHLLMYPLKVGDWVTYRHAVDNLAHLPSERCAVVAEIERDHTKVQGTTNPKPYLLMQLTGTGDWYRKGIQHTKTDPWSRWDDFMSMVLVDDVTRARLNDDFVQDYIKKHIEHARTYIR